jgi:hypothetical protein
MKFHEWANIFLPLRFFCLSQWDFLTRLKVELAASEVDRSGGARDLSLRGNTIEDRLSFAIRNYQAGFSEYLQMVRKEALFHP